MRELIQTRRQVILTGKPNEHHLRVVSVGREENLLGDERSKLALFVKLFDNVEATDELAIDIELRVGRPVTELFQSLSHFIVTEDIKGAEADLFLVEDLHDLLAEAASGLLGCTCIR